MEPEARDDPPEALGRADFALAAALALVVGTLYGSTLLQRLTGDGAGLAGFHALGRGTYYNVLYLPACDVVEALLSPSDPLLAPKALSVAGAALGAACAYLVCRLFAAPRLAALAAVLLFVGSRALWFFGTTIEVHALHFGAVGLCACVTLLAPWRRPALALALTAAVFPLLYWTQQTAALLGPGWVLLVQYARARRAPPFRWRFLLGVVGPVLLAVLLGAVAVRNALFESDFASQSSPLDQILFHRSLDLRGNAWWHEWVRPLGVIVPLAAVGSALVALGRARLPRFAGPALAALLLPPLAFFLWWGVIEDGGYFLGSDAFLLVPVALVFRRLGPRTWALAAVLISAQGGLTRVALDRWDEGFPIAERVARVRAALGGDTGYFVSTVDYAPPIAVYLPAVEETPLWHLVRVAEVQTGLALEPEDVVRELLPLAERQVAERGRVVLELAHVHQEGRAIDAELKRHMAALEVALRERFATRVLDDPWWPMMVLEPR